MPWYNKGKYAFASGDISWLGDTVKVLLVGSGASFNPDHNFISDLSGELSGPGYVGGFGGTGRKALQGKAVIEDDANDAAILDGSDLLWPAINAGTAYAVVLVRELSSDADSLLLAYIPFLDGFSMPQPIATNGGDLNVQWSPNGILRLI